MERVSVRDKVVVRGEAMAPKFKAHKANLEEQKARLTRDLENANERRKENLAPPDESTYSNHMADVGTLTYQQEENMALERHISRQLGEANAALARIENGTYGICTNCGKPINAERLEALPTATLCLDCKSRQAQPR